MLTHSKENLHVLIEHHPYAKSLNKKLLETSKEYHFSRDFFNEDGGPSNVRALQTLGIVKSEVLSMWILSLIRNEPFLRIPQKISMEQMWMVKYNKGDFTQWHHHKPAFMSFVYFVKTPRGSSPLVFTTSGKRIKAEEGKVVIFPGSMKHHVPKNRCDGRIVLAGNVVPGQLLKDMNP